jgi:redox-sensitive bicupin YhaK (pirin superfamily)
LPTELEETAPSFHHHAIDALPIWQVRGLTGRLIAGAPDGLTAGLEVHPPLFYLHWEMNTGSSRLVPRDHRARAIFVAVGEIAVDHAVVRAVTR